MNHAGNDVLAGSAFSLDENRDVRAGNFIQLLPNRLHDTGFAKDNGIRRDLAKRLH